jgi:hypothetical protein
MLRAWGIAILTGWLFAVGLPVLPAGGQSQLATDDALRAGMMSIRASIIDHHTLITHRRLPVARARSFASSIERIVAAIRTETTVASSSRAVLDPLLVTILTSAQAISAGGDSIQQMDALFAITKAIETYGETFDHPDWKPIRER